MSRENVVKGLIFDFDGLILDSETPSYTAWRECYEAHGHALPVEIFVQCVGTDHVEYDPARELEQLCGRELDWEILGRDRQRRTGEMLDGSDAMPGVREILAEALALGLSCAVASSSPRSWVDPWLERLEVRELFSSTHCLEDVERPKPDPALFLRAARALGAEPGEVIVFEDSLHGLRAAQAAGMRCVVVPNPVTRHLDFDGAHRLLESLAEVSLAELLGGGEA